jgi:hypothetical protein
LLRVHSIQTQAIDPVFVPKHPSQSFAKKADFALSLGEQHEAVKRTLRADPDRPLSQMTDAATSTVPLVCGVEVKEQGGGYNEAIMQLAVWSAAGLARLEGLWKDAGVGTVEDGIMPFVGLTVVGHEWRLRIAWKERAEDGDGDVVSLALWMGAKK